MSDLQVIVRTAEAADAHAIWRVHVAAIRGVAEYYSPEHIAEWAAKHSPNSYGAIISAGRLFVAEVRGEIIGFGQFDPQTGEVERAYVNPGHANRGVGRLLMQEAERRAGVADLAHIYLFASLNAVQFYLRCGYRRAACAIGSPARANHAETRFMTKAVGR